MELAAEQLAVVEQPVASQLVAVVAPGEPNSITKNQTQHTANEHTYRSDQRHVRCFCLYAMPLHSISTRSLSISLSGLMCVINIECHAACHVCCLLPVVARLLFSMWLPSVLLLLPSPWEQQLLLMVHPLVHHRSNQHHDVDDDMESL